MKFKTVDFHLGAIPDTLGHAVLYWIGSGCPRKLKRNLNLQLFKQRYPDLYKQYRRDYHNGIIISRKLWTDFGKDNVFLIVDSIDPNRCEKQLQIFFGLMLSMFWDDILRIYCVLEPGAAEEQAKLITQAVRNLDLPPEEEPEHELVFLAEPYQEE